MFIPYYKMLILSTIKRKWGLINYIMILINLESIKNKKNYNYILIDLIIIIMLN